MIGFEVRVKGSCIARDSNGVCNFEALCNVQSLGVPGVGVSDATITRRTYAKEDPSSVGKKPDGVG